MTVNLQSIFISSLNSEKKMWSSDEKKKPCLKTLEWLELAEVYLNYVTKHL